LHLEFLEASSDLHCLQWWYMYCPDPALCFRSPNKLYSDLFQCPHSFLMFDLGSTGSWSGPIPLWSMMRRRGLTSLASPQEVFGRSMTSLGWWLRGRDQEELLCCEQLGLAQCKLFSGCCDFGLIPWWFVTWIILMISLLPMVLLCRFGELWWTDGVCLVSL
jgi:hypothetical protein